MRVVMTSLMEGSLWFVSGEEREKTRMMIKSLQHIAVKSMMYHGNKTLCCNKAVSAADYGVSINTSVSTLSCSGWWRIRSLSREYRVCSSRNTVHPERNVFTSMEWFSRTKPSSGMWEETGENQIDTGGTCGIPHREKVKIRTELGSQYEASLAPALSQQKLAQSACCADKSLPSGTQVCDLGRGLRLRCDCTGTVFK